MSKKKIPDDSTLSELYLDQKMSSGDIAKEQVKKAIQFAVDNTYEGETLLLSGVGTGIGKNNDFTEDDFVEVLKELLVN